MSEQKAKTLNGAPTPRSSLNTESPDLLKNATTGPLARVSRLYRRLNEIMSGMYTGVGCVGTPHEVHSYSEGSKNDPPAD